MNRLLLIAIVFFAASSKAQQNSLFWEISGNGVAMPSYLYGTMHLRDSKLFCLPDSAQLRLDSCNTLALEIVIDFNDTKALFASILVQDEKQYLSEILTKQEYKKVKKAVRENCDVATLLLMDKMRPFMLAAALMEAQHKSDVKLPMDLQFQKNAEERGNKLVSLESVSSQIAVLDKIPIEMQKKELLATVDSLKQNKILLDSLVSMYLRQDLNGLMLTSENSSADFDSLFQAEFLDQRNINMVNGIVKLLPPGNAFIAVGAAHLAGEKGLIALLRKEGYVVRPVYSKCSK